MRLFKFLVIGMVLASCAGGGDTRSVVTRAGPQNSAHFLTPHSGVTAPGVTVMAAPGPRAQAGYSRRYLAHSFMELSFALESGRNLAHFSRFEGPISLRMTGDVPARAEADLRQLLARLRNEAGITLITTTAEDNTASITVNFAPRAQLRKAVANAACFIVPNVTTLDQYLASRDQAITNWAVVAQRRHVGMFVPSDASAQEVRDCLHEELAQALGPLNDLYRLSDSVFNDDNFRSVLSDFDMLMLRATYAPELQTGMSRAEVAGKIDAVFARLQPDNHLAAREDFSPTPRAWTQYVQLSVDPSASNSLRAAAAQRAIALAQTQGWQDARMAFSHFLYARQMLSSDRSLALHHYQLAADLYRTLPGAGLQVAHIDMQLAALALSAGQTQAALIHAEAAIAIFRQQENYTQLATTELIKAKALERLGQKNAVATLRASQHDVIAYGLGSGTDLRRRMHEVARLGRIWF